GAGLIDCLCRSCIIFYENNFKDFVVRFDRRRAVPNKLRDAGEPDFRAPRYFQFSFATRPGAGAPRADSLRDVDECGLAGLGFARTESGGGKVRKETLKPGYFEG